MIPIFSWERRLIARSWCGDILFRVRHKTAFKVVTCHCSIFQAEVFVIGKAAELASNVSAGNSRVTIYVDSQAAIKGVISYSISAWSVLESKTAVESVARNKILHFCWVSGHKGIYGKETLYEVAKGVSVWKTAKTMCKAVDQDKVPADAW